MGSLLVKFLLLTWKNWIIEIRHCCAMVTQIIVICLVLLLLYGLRRIFNAGPVQPEYGIHAHPQQQRDAQSRNEKSFKCENRQLSWSPNGTLLSELMNTYCKELELNCTGYKNKRELETAAEKSLEYFDGIEFDDELYDMTSEWPRDIKLTFRYAIMKDAVNKMDWHVKDQFRFLTKRDTKLNTYESSCFLQMEVFLMEKIYVFLKKSKGEKVPSTMFNVMPEEFPKPKKQKPSLDDGQLELTVLLTFLIIIPLSILLQSVIIENELQIKEVMKMMGLPNCIHWMAWSAKYFVTVFLILILFMVFFKAPIPETTDLWYANRYDVITVFFFLYACAIVNFTYLFSSFFSRSFFAIFAYLWYHIMTTVTLSTLMQSSSRSVKLCLCLLCNVAFFFGIGKIENANKFNREFGLKNCNYRDTYINYNDLTMAEVLIMLAVDTIIYILVIFYIQEVFPGEFGVAKKWYFCFTFALPKRCIRSNRIANLDDTNTVSADSYEAAPPDKKVGIQIINLQKTFDGKTYAVKNLSLNMYQDEISVLLGHNGAGKTTTICILTGMFRPSNGTAIVNGYDIKTDLDKVRKTLGLCPQHNILFNELTVKEHLVFYGLLRGIRCGQLKQEVKSYLTKFQFVGQENKRSKHLSGGMKRRLSVMCALFGGTKTVLLDEPTAGMDPSVRRKLWDILKAERQGRTILLTTHFMDEADLLGDRIAIMNEGQLRCTGTGFFLKKKFGEGYRLVIDKSPTCNVDQITQLLKKNVSGIEVQSDAGGELTYSLPEKYSSSYGSILKELDEKKKELGISNYGISLTTIEDVFLKVGSETQGITKRDAANKIQRILSSRSTNLPKVTLWRRQFVAMWIKMFYSKLGSFILLILFFLLPILQVLLTFGNDVFQRDSDNEFVNISLANYHDPVVLISGSGQYLNAYGKLVELSGGSLKVVENVSSFINAMYKEEDMETVYRKYIAGAEFSGNNIVAWYNFEAYHSSPLSILLIFNAIIQSKYEDHTISLVNHPIATATPDPHQNPFEMGKWSFILDIFSLLGAILILFYVMERTCKATHLQYLSGVNPLIFWSVAFLYNFILVTLVIIMTLTIVYCIEKAFFELYDMMRLSTLLLLGVYAYLGYIYVLSLIFTSPGWAFIVMYTTNMLMVHSADYIMLIVLALVVPDELNGLDDVDPYRKILYFHPLYILKTTFVKIDNANNMALICREMCKTDQSCLAQVCAMNNMCCGIGKFAWKPPGIGKYLVILATVGTIYFLFLLLWELYVLRIIGYIIGYVCRGRDIRKLEEDDDVIAEKDKIKNMSKKELRQYQVTMRNLSKKYRCKPAVRGLYVGINKGECFGLLGENGAGKTSTFRMLTCDLSTFRGNGWVAGCSLKTGQNALRGKSGYCPQFDALFTELTGRQNLIMFGMIRGISYNQAKELTAMLAEEFGFSQYLDRKVRKYSGGNKRKVNAAIAVFAAPEVVFLDEPSTGMDPAAKRKMWNILSALRDTGSAIVLTSHSMEECEALCTQVGIMVQGNFRCLGTSQHIKSKYCNGYVLVTKVKRDDEAKLLAKLDNVKKFVKSNFTKVVVKEEFGEMITFFIEDKDLTCSKLFGVMEGAKSSIQLEDYTLSQSSLEQVFLMFTQNQGEEAD